MPGSMLNASPTTSGDAVALDEVWVLVALETDAVAQPVEERRAVPGGIDDGPRGPVQVLRRHPRTDRVAVPAWLAASTRAWMAANVSSGPLPPSLPSPTGCA